MRRVAKKFITPLEDKSPRGELLRALEAWITQGPGLDPANYTLEGFRADSKKIVTQRSDALELLRFVLLRDGITYDMLVEATKHAFSGRLTWDGKAFSYCTGQYWPTEYRAAACAVLASAIWKYLANAVGLQDAPAIVVRDAAKVSFSTGVYRRWFD